MNWKPTAALAFLLVALAGVYWWGDSPPADDETRRSAIDEREFDRIAILRGTTEILLERRTDQGSPTWMISKPSMRRADAFKVQEMITGILFRPERVVRPGHPDWKPDLYGVDKPGLTVRAASGKREHVIHFGNSVPVDPNQVYVRIEGRETIYVVAASIRKAFEAEATDLRERKVLAVELSRTQSISGRHRYTRVTGSGAQEAHDEFTLVRDLADAGKGWFLRKPHDERLDDGRVASFLSEMTDLYALRYVPMDEAMKAKFASPELSYEFMISGRERPWKIAFAESPKGDPDEVAVHVEGEEDVAWIQGATFRRLPDDSHAFRTDNPFDFDVGSIEEILLATPISRLKIAPVRKKDGEIETLVWKVTEPALRVEEGAVEPFVQGLMSVRILGYQSPQTDLRAFGLDPPEVTITFRVRRGTASEERSYLFGRVGDLEDGYMKKAWHGELHVVPAHYVRVMALADLNLRSKEVFSVPRDSITGFSFDWKLPVGNQYLKVGRSAEGKWEFLDPQHRQENRGVDPERVKEILARLNFIQAEAFIGAGEADAARFGLDGPNPHGRIVIEHRQDGASREKVLRLSENLGEPASPIHYGRFEDSPVVFRVDAKMILDLQQDVHKKPKPVEPRPGDHGHGH